MNFTQSDRFAEFVCVLPANAVLVGVTGKLSNGVYTAVYCTETDIMVVNAYDVTETDTRFEYVATLPITLKPGRYRTPEMVLAEYVRIRK